MTEGVEEKNIRQKESEEISLCILTGSFYNVLSTWCQPYTSL